MYLPIHRFLKKNKIPSYWTCLILFKFIFKFIKVSFKAFITEDYLVYLLQISKE